MAHDVFISYSSKNKNTADAICHVLEQQKIRCWIAPRNIAIGEKYGNIIEEAIRNSKIFIIVFSKESSVSPWVESELNLAFTDRKIIMPFRIDETNLEGEMRLILNNKHWIEAYPNPELKFKDLIEAVSRLIWKPILDDLGKTNLDIQKELQEERAQLEIEKEKLRQKQLENEKAQQPNAEKQNLNGDINSQNKSKVIYEQNLPKSRTKRNALIILTIVVIVAFLKFVLNKNTNRFDDNNEVESPIGYVDSAAIDPVDADSAAIIQNDYSNESRTNTNTNTNINKTGTLIDSRDSHVYKWVKISNQIWMAENLAYKINDGCWAYDNNENNAKKYGYLYNWDTAINVCPKGWHLPSEGEWKTLIESIPRDSVWTLLNENSGWKLFNGNLFRTSKHDKLTGFCALPGGLMADGGEGDFRRIGEAGYWWSSSTYSASHAFECILSSDSYKYFLNIIQYWKQAGLSVRCIRD